MGSSAGRAWRLAFIALLVRTQKGQGRCVRRRERGELKSEVTWRCEHLGPLLDCCTILNWESKPWSKKHRVMDEIPQGPWLPAEIGATSKLLPSGASVTSSCHLPRPQSRFFVRLTSHHGGSNYVHCSLQGELVTRKVLHKIQQS